MRFPLSLLPGLLLSGCAAQSANLSASALNAEKGSKVSICHRTGSGARNALSVSASAQGAHLGHGDVLAGACYVDADEDGFGSAFASATVCPTSPAYAAVGGDCGDNDALVNPDAEEVPGNDLDDDCDPSTPGEQDDDLDGDGYDADEDCDDTDDTINPGEPEVYGDGIDQDCDGADAAWKAISAGYLHTCAIDAAGAARCWGFDGFGQTTLP